eukprot:TRINITY_DN678_c0_g1_i1.p2 TRINITY_DN678_c0_g1~~TRINITY_DN678_c0_g1_i1.p2  ORF type:complete len:487 (+),score=94.63 TRINITY_DN678_c0_g1_i1:1910-3370(+)
MLQQLIADELAARENFYAEEQNGFHEINSIWKKSEEYGEPIRVQCWVNFTAGWLPKEIEISSRPSLASLHNAVHKIVGCPVTLRFMIDENGSVVTENPYKHEKLPESENSDQANENTTTEAEEKEGEEDQDKQDDKDDKLQKLKAYEDAGRGWRFRPKVVTNKWVPLTEFTLPMFLGLSPELWNRYRGWTSYMQVKHGALFCRPLYGSVALDPPVEEKPKRQPKLPPFLQETMQLIEHLEKEHKSLQKQNSLAPPLIAMYHTTSHVLQQESAGRRKETKTLTQELNEILTGVSQSPRTPRLTPAQQSAHLGRVFDLALFRRKDFQDKEEKKRLKEMEAFKAAKLNAEKQAELENRLIKIPAERKRAWAERRAKELEKQRQEGVVQTEKLSQQHLHDLVQRQTETELKKRAAAMRLRIQKIQNEESHDMLKPADPKLFDQAASTRRLYNEAIERHTAVQKQLKEKYNAPAFVPHPPTKLPRPVSATH